MDHTIECFDIRCHHISTDGSVSVTTNDGMITANVVTADVKALNGVIHVIDNVLIPGQMETVTTPTPDTPTTAVSLPNIVETAQSIDDFSTLVAAVVAADLVDTLSSPGPFTVFAPLNSAFAELGQEKLNELLANPDQLSSILTYHVVSGEAFSTDLSDGQQIETVNGASVTVSISMDGGVMIDGAKVVTADVKASNGVIHVIDKVLIPDAPTTPQTVATVAPLPNIVKTAQSIDDFSTLVTAVVAADLVDTLSSPGPFTVFAPVNAAFAELGQEKLNELLANPDQLSSILAYHVVSGEAFSTDLSDGQQIETVNGASVTVSISMDGGVMIDGAKVVTADVKA